VVEYSLLISLLFLLILSGVSLNDYLSLFFFGVIEDLLETIDFLRDIFYSFNLVF
jgi:hypothetical protein